MAVHVAEFRASAGGFLKLALQGVAGSGDITGVSLAPSQVCAWSRVLQAAAGHVAG